MAKNILVLEDSNSAREMLTKCVNEIEEYIEIYQASSLMEAYSICVQYTIDVFLVDIVLNKRESGDVSGLTFVEKLREINKYKFTPVIFISSLADPKLYTFMNMHSFGYLEKPYDPEVVKKLVKEALHYTTTRKTEENMYFRKDGVIYCLKSNEIIYMESANHRLYVQTIRERMTFPYIKCAELMEKIKDKEFVQCSRSTIVNKEFIYAFDQSNRYIVLRDGYGNLEVGSTYLSKLEQEYIIDN